MNIKYGTILLNLNKSEEELWQQVHKKNRWSVSKARKLGVTIRSGKNSDQKVCYSLYKETCKINHLHPNGKQKVFGAGTLLVAEFESNIVAFSVINYAKKAKLIYNASNYEYRHTEANSLLYWEGILKSKKRRMKSFDLGGVDTQAKYRHGNDRFKMRWGGELSTTQQEVSLPSYLWWRYLRRYAWIRKTKYNIKARILK